MPNIYTELRAAIGIRSDPIHVVTVVALAGDSQSLVQYDGGAQRLVYGQEVAIGAHAYVRADQILGPAPDVALVDVEI